jgi:CheY-like chemotaxis protein
MRSGRRYIMAKAKILVVDDDVDFVESTAAILEARGYEVIPAYNGEEGLKKAKSELPQLIIIDLMMNTINEGYGFCLDIRRDKRFKEVPLLMISSAHQTDIFKDLNFVPDDIWFPIDTFLDKPVDRDTLLQHVDKLLK